MAAASAPAETVHGRFALKPRMRMASVGAETPSMQWARQMGAISRRSSRLTRRLLATPSIVRGDGLRDRRGRWRWRIRG